MLATLEGTDDGAENGRWEGEKADVAGEEFSLS